MSGTMDAFVFKEHRCYRCKYYERRWKCGCKDSLYYAHECDSNFWCDNYECADEVELKRRERNK